MFAEELLASARANAGLPESLEDALLWRLESVPPDVRDVLGIAAVAGRTVDDALLAAVAGLSNGELTAALHAAVDGDILTHDPESTGYSFRHALLREATYGDLLPRRRRALHTTVAETLTRRPGACAAPPRPLSSPITGTRQVGFQRLCARRSRRAFRPNASTPSPRP